MTSLLYNQTIGSLSLPYPTTPQTGKTVVITGSNTGLGLEAARHYARLGASRLVLAVRDVAAGTAARRSIACPACPESSIAVWQLDLASHAGVRRFAARVNAELDRVDVFLANAGVAGFKYARAEEAGGEERMLAVNVISTFLLGALVMPKLVETARKGGSDAGRPVLSFTSSAAHFGTTFPQKDDPGAAGEGALFRLLSDKTAFETKYARDQYPVTKMLGIYAVRALAAQWPDCPVTVSAVDPGLCHSGLSREAEGSTAVMFAVIKFLLARSTEKGSRCLVHAGESEGVEFHGKYLQNTVVKEPSRTVTDNEGGIQERVWRELCAKIDEVQPGVSGNFLASSY